ncbi:MAG: exodeoxyribonuclease VII large subunit [Candidatus Kapabacteria bacterium]|jgi:exodeoxyribonuclease VII large subunit|nr:exodeoxyribonuclease VII large subunit [Candidatus Kapabacteria bacterium]
MDTQIITVSDLTQSISMLLKEAIGSVKIQGEISNFKAHSSGHRYFTLKDSNSQVSCTMWRSRTLNFKPTDGMEVILSGRVTVYPPRGTYQIDCVSMKPVGQGDLFMAYEALKKKLSDDGWFGTEYKRPLPRFAMNIGVSTSPTGAAVKDIFSTVKRRFPACNIYFRPTLVQGEGAAPDIVKAIKELSKTPAEVLIIGRGGGSLEDMWCFNTEEVAEVIHDCDIPIISAVGHETDFTIADFVADYRAATPTAAAELVTPVTKDNFIQILTDSQSQMKRTAEDMINNSRSDIDGIISSYAFRSVEDRVKTLIRQTDDYEISMTRAMKNKTARVAGELKSLEAQCRSLYPLAPIRKGFALLESEGKIVGANESLGNLLKVNILRESETVEVGIEKISGPAKLLRSDSE